MQQAKIGALNILAQKEELVSDFLELISFDTKADGNATCVPSSPGQLRLAAFLHQKLVSLGIETKITKEGVVIAKIKASEGCEKAPHLALFAHLDTAGDFSGENVKAALVTSYEGQGIELKNGLKTTHEIIPELAHHLGEDIIVTDGTTLLGADDKAGVAVLLSLAKACMSLDKPLEHGPLTLVFSVDEEIGLSVTHIDVPSLNADVGVTIDGSELGELDTQTFNAALATLTFEGLSVHTCCAKGKLVNALKVARDFLLELPQEEAPETTEGLEGFYHPYELQGGTAEATLKVLIRDFDEDNFKKRQDFILEKVSLVNQKWGREVCKAKIDFQYHNMKKYLDESKFEIVKWCEMAYEKAGVKVFKANVRGGTDGSNLSALGLPTPNIFTGALACHGPYECLPVKSFLKSRDCVFSLVKIISKVA